MTRLTFLLVLLLGASFGCEEPIEHPPATPGTGQITVVDQIGPAGKTGWWPTIALDSQETPHLAWCDVWNGDLKYATRASDGSWNPVTVAREGAVGKYTSLAVGPDDRPAISYYDQTMKFLKFSFQDAEGKWNHENVAWGLEAGMGSELRFDAQGRPNLFYYLPSGKLVHGRRSKDGSWSKKVIMEVTGAFSVKISPVLREDGFWVSFVNWNFKDTILLLARPTDQEAQTYSIETIAERDGPGWRSQLFFENNKPQIIYSQNRRRQIWLAQTSPEGWKYTQVIHNALTFSAKLTEQKTYAIAYEDMTGPSTDTSGVVKILRGRGTVWKQDSVDHEGPGGEHLAMVTTKSGKAIVAYFSRTIRGLKIYDETVKP